LVITRHNLGIRIDPALISLSKNEDQPARITTPLPNGRRIISPTLSYQTFHNYLLTKILNSPSPNDQPHEKSLTRPKQKDI
jgi:hypothetical protein